MEMASARKMLRKMTWFLVGVLLIIIPFSYAIATKSKKAHSGQRDICTTSAQWKAHETGTWTYLNIEQIGGADSYRHYPGWI